MLSIRFLVAVCLLPLFVDGLFAKEQPPVYTHPRQAKRNDPAFAVQGEYLGELGDEQVKVGLQVIALGNDKFQAVPRMGGLPGAGWDGERLPPIEATLADDGSVTFQGDTATGVYQDGAIRVLIDGNEVGSLQKVHRKSKTLGKKPPAGAVVLFDGTDTDAWNNAVKLKKLLAFDPQGRGATSKQKWGSHSLHIEFRLPYMPEARGQGRGNSGLYLQARYEVQMLDSFGLEGRDNECGGIYSIAKPKVNMCLPPLTWQTYDVDFTAAKYGDNGALVEHPRITVRHNGELIHENLELPKSTTASPLKPGPEDGPVYLQNHGNPVRYRNIWVIPRED